MLRILKKAIVPDDECCFATDECNFVRCSACEANSMYDVLFACRLSRCCLPLHSCKSPVLFVRPKVQCGSEIMKAGRSRWADRTYDARWQRVDDQGLSLACWRVLMAR
jgi:hypothetical protein